MKFIISKTVIPLITLMIAGFIMLSGAVTYGLKKEINSIMVKEESGQIKKNTSQSYYKEGDWKEYILDEYYNLPTTSGDIKNREFFEIDGEVKLNLTYGKSLFLKDKYKVSDDDRPVSSLVTEGFTPETDMRLLLKGSAGDRLTYYIDHDNKREENKNYYKIEYKAVKDNEILRELQAGDIDIKINKSKYAIYDSGTTKALGINGLFKKGDLEINAFASIIKGESEIERFRGTSSTADIKLAEYQYVKNTYYQLEPYKRYDNLSIPPVISSANSSYDSLITFSSAPSNPSTYRNYNVNIQAGSLELYLDDQDPYNNSSATRLTAIDNGYYNKLQSGVDYSFNNSTGVITFIRNIPSNGRIYALYNLSGGSTATADPSARTDIVSGKIFVFIKYDLVMDEDLDRDYSQNSDKNGDGMMNLDIYEIRSYYYLTEKGLKTGSVFLSFYKENEQLDTSEIEKTGKYTIDSDSGLVNFYLREPFRTLIDADNRPKIYSENLSTNVFNYSVYSLRATYERDSREFHLKHSNIIPGSVSVKIDDHKINDSLFSVDHESGILRFIDDKNPLINEDSLIEIRYEYSETGEYSETFSAGVRGDYKVNNNLSLGGTLLYTTEGTGEIVPEVGSEPVSNIVYEGDVTVDINENKMKKLVNQLSGQKIASVPVAVKGYFEYARSIFYTNRFGKAMVDDMEAGDDFLSLNMSEKEWQLSSLPQGINQNQRAQLLYKYYRDPESPEELMGEGFSFYDIDYSVKPGPYNIGDSHYTGEKRTDDTNYSLVFNMDYSYGDNCSAVTRRLSETSVDLSGLQYIEVWYRAAAGSGDVNMTIDLGKINEDSDGDGLLDTEDENLNSFLDYDPRENIMEDRGFIFDPSGETATRVGGGPRLNSSTKGDGRLNSEDLNRNGTLDLADSIITCPGTKAIIPDGAPLSTVLQLDLADREWKKQRIYLVRSSLSDDDLDILQNVQALRINFADNSAATGVVYVDSIRLVYSRWNDIRINNVSTEDPDRVNVTMVDTYNDSEYENNSFVKLKKSEYESLYGDLDSDEQEEEKEGALQLDYDLSPSERATIIKKSHKQMDLRYYDTLNLWVNSRELSGETEMTFRLGSSYDDYQEYDFTLPSTGSWHKITLKLNKDSSGANDYITSGYPDLKRINLFQVEVTGGSGRIWINNIYASDPSTVEDQAWWAEAEVKVTEPVYKTQEGTPVFSDIDLKYVHKGHGSGYVSPGKNLNDVDESSHEISSGMNILPNWKNYISYNRTVADSGMYNEDYSGDLRGKTTNNTILWNSSYVSDANGIPSIYINYKHDRVDNKQGEYIYPERIERRTGRNSYSPKIFVEEEVRDLFSGKLVMNLVCDLLFTEETIEREGDNGSLISNSNIVLNEEQGTQKNSLAFDANYVHPFFYINPEYRFFSHELVSYKGKERYNNTNVLDSFTYGYHLPFKYDDGDFRFVERTNQLEFNWGVRGYFVKPEEKISFSYNETNFRDFDSDERSTYSNYKRTKYTSAEMEHRINIPFYFSSIKGLKFIKNLNISFVRKQQFREEEVPFESEATSIYNEEYGLTRAFKAMEDSILNIIKNPPWHYFTGRGNYARGRDNVNTIQNRRFSLGNSEYSLYDNEFMQEDKIAFESYLEFKPVTLIFTSSMEQRSERFNIETAPLQNVTMNNLTNISMDLMEIFDSGFFRPNRYDKPFHAAKIDMGFSFTRMMMVTSNIREDSYSPFAGFSIQSGKTKFSFRTGIDFRIQENVEYIATASDRPVEDNIYYAALPDTKVDQADRGYSLLAEYEMDLPWLGDFFRSFYEIRSNPLWLLSYELKINRYDYQYSVSPEPYDMHLIKTSLNLDIHKNIKGELDGLIALEKYRNRDTEGVNREIFSYQLGFSLTVVF